MKSKAAAAAFVVLLIALSWDMAGGPTIAGTVELRAGRPESTLVLLMQDAARESNGSPIWTPLAFTVSDPRNGRYELESPEAAQANLLVAIPVPGSSLVVFRRLTPDTSGSVDFRSPPIAPEHGSLEVHLHS